MDVECWKEEQGKDLPEQTDKSSAGTATRSLASSSSRRWSSRGLTTVAEGTTVLCEGC